MDNLLNICSQPKLNQEDINDLNNPNIYNEIESVTKSLPTFLGPRRAQDLMDSGPNFSKTLKKN
jgi:hypothetical protein